MSLVELTEEEREHIYHSIYVRIGFIETCTASRAEDMVRSNPSYKPRVLSKEVRETVIALGNLATKILKS